MILIMNNKHYIKKGREYKNDIKGHSYGYFIVVIILIVLFVILSYVA